MKPAAKIHKKKRPNSKLTSAHQRWLEWFSTVWQGKISASSTLPADEQRLLLQRLLETRRLLQRRALIVLAQGEGFSQNQIASFLVVSRLTVRNCMRKFHEGGDALLFSRKVKRRKTDDAALKTAIFALLHEPPSLSGINRTSWKLSDFQKVLAERGFKACSGVIRTIFKEAGYRWKSARVALTSNDPAYREKLANIQHILANLGERERFFSIDEFGPFAVKMKGGKKLVPPGLEPTIPQWQKSKGVLILTAALELSHNQVSHFYSKVKNTDEMIRMAEMLVTEYASASKLYLSWDAASWHLSKKLKIFIELHNLDARDRQLPLIELAPLPAGAQFLNVIESIFSGMARAIIHNSDYASISDAMQAMDKYFAHRNQHFKTSPQRAGNKIWGLEKIPSFFTAANNCKDPLYR